MLAPDALQQAGDVGHDPRGGLVQQLLGDRLTAQVVQLDRRPGPDVHHGPREDPRPPLVRGHDVVGAPLGARDDRAPGLQGDPGGAGLAAHGPQTGVAGQRPLGVDHDALPRAHRGDGRAQRVDRVRLAAVDRDLPGPPDDPTPDRDSEDRLLAQEPRPPPVGVQEVRIGERVEVAHVVHHGHEAAGRRQVLGALPVALGEEHEQRLQDDHREEVPPASARTSRRHWVGRGHVGLLLGHRPVGAATRCGQGHSLSGPQARVHEGRTGPNRAHSGGCEDGEDDECRLGARRAPQAA